MRGKGKHKKGKEEDEQSGSLRVSQNHAGFGFTSETSLEVPNRIGFMYRTQNTHFILACCAMLADWPSEVKTVVDSRYIILVI